MGFLLMKGAGKGKGATSGGDSSKQQSVETYYPKAGRLNHMERRGAHSVYTVYVVNLHRKVGWWWWWWHGQAHLVGAIRSRSPACIFLIRTQIIGRCCCIISHQGVARPYACGVGGCTSTSSSLSLSTQPHRSSSADCQSICFVPHPCRKHGPYHSHRSVTRPGRAGWRCPVAAALASHSGVMVVVEGV